MWVFEVANAVEPIALFNFKPLGVTSTLLILLCYARIRGLARVIHVRCECCYLMVNLRRLLKYTSRWIGCGHLGIYQCCPLVRHPGSKGS